MKFNFKLTHLNHNYFQHIDYQSFNFRPEKIA